ncbi:4Fe-4S dicluster domain-containing protein [Aminobacter aminovorans]|uniref:Cytochrome c oxidase accessory protein CcoG n=1 Tax=Aminobacter aminovorans TaxID=83263 RepID=A0AAC9AT76_AMIAI|nr:4Fe-4S dicluster domain-containing protein [Aminobacter aminovorans]AMS44896.1 Cytochrome c oxidase accessory protein CcoG [Aminobacter aminovorans]MBB3704916.1 polyferredoxin [Aminobacter aminovorans]
MDFQVALLDRDSLIVTYQDWRGEPRGRKRLPLKRALVEPTLYALARQASDLGGQLAGRGDCIDCTRCVTACPTGVDIRKGLQMGCIGCGLCIDACKDVMRKLGQPEGLIRFDSESSAEQQSFAAPKISWRRPKAFAFAGSVALALSISAYGAATMPGFVAHADPQRNPPFVLLSDGSVRNDYTLRLAHRVSGLDLVTVGIEGLEGAVLRLASDPASPDVRIGLGTGRSAGERVLVTYATLYGSCSDWQPQSDIDYVQEGGARFANTALRLRAALRAQTIQ